jgi:amino acid transporter
MIETTEEERPVPSADRLDVLKRVVVGRPRASGEMGETLLSKTLALPIFASDPLSSVAYATEAALAVLIAASAGSGHLVLPISIAIAAVLAIVVLSYTQTVQAYETSGGAYVVARDNLGTLPSLVAAGALLADYILTVAVSVTAGVFALSSAAPSFGGHKVALSLLFVGILTLVNLRGVRESGILFALPTYGFVLAMLAMIGTGVGKCALGTCTQAHVPDPLAAGAGAVGVFVVLRAFASGAAALTGVEAISNGVSAFRPPAGKNAARTLLIMGAIAITLFIGVSYLAVHMHARPSASVSVVSEIARAVFPSSSWTSFMYYAVQGLTFAILVLAANTSYQGFPRLGAVLARDRFFPRQFINLGDRLVYSNGIIVLAAIASFLIWIFHADVLALIHLYVIGVFTAFTLSQAGMVRYWARRRDPGWQKSATLNAVGSLATGVVALLVIQAKFTSGAWAVIVAIPLMIVGFHAVNRHYRKVERRVRAGAAADEQGRAVRRVGGRGAARGTLVCPSDRRRRLPRNSRTWLTHRSGDQAALSDPDRHPARPSGPGARGRPGRCRDRVPLGAAARGVELRHGDHPRALQATLPAGSPLAAHGVLAQAAPTDGARRRDHGRARARAERRAA